MESRSRGVLDTPLEPVIGLAEGETRWRGMTARCAGHYGKPGGAGFRPPALQTPAHLLFSPRATSLNRAPGRTVMAKGQMRSNKEKKKPKADKNLKKGGAAPSPFSSGKVQMQAGQNPTGKK